MASEQMKAFDFANEVTKQLITLSTAILALSVTFVDKFAALEGGDPGFLKWSWILLITSVVLGLITLSGLTAQLQPKRGDTANPSIWAKPVVIPSSLQYLSFLAALVLLMLFADGAIT